MRKLTAFIICLIACGSFGSGMLLEYAIFPRTTPEQVDTSGIIYITSIDNGDIVHSKIWIDATFPEGTYEKEVRINGTKKANYTPFLWNNMQEKAGRYHIKVIGKYHKGNENGTAEREIIVIIPFNETFTGDRNDFTEDHVIHEGQVITWQYGHFNLSTSQITNGGGLYVEQALDIYGKLICINVTISGLKGEMSGGVNLDQPRINIRRNGILELINCSMPANYACLFDSSKLYINSSSISIYNMGNGTVIYL